MCRSGILRAVNVAAEKLAPFQHQWKELETNSLGEGRCSKLFTALLPNFNIRLLFFPKHPPDNSDLRLCFRFLYAVRSRAGQQRQGRINSLSKQPFKQKLAKGRAVVCRQERLTHPASHSRRPVI